VRFEIDILRCVFCGYCEEACPVDAIRLGHDEYTMVGLPTDKVIYTKDHLLNRPQLGGRNISRKLEERKHPTVNTTAGNEALRSLAAHVSHHAQPTSND
jgi:NADH-quinone oxidoreductase subunit I